MIKDQKQKQFRIMILNNMKTYKANRYVCYDKYYVKYGKKTYYGFSPDNVINQINKEKLRSANDLKGTKKLSYKL